jgi:hypothetical protein
VVAYGLARPALGAPGRVPTDWLCPHTQRQRCVNVVLFTNGHPAEHHRPGHRADAARWGRPCGLRVSAGNDTEQVLRRSKSGRGGESGIAPLHALIIAKAPASQTHDTEQSAFGRMLSGRPVAPIEELQHHRRAMMASAGRHSNQYMVGLTPLVRVPVHERLVVSPDGTRQGWYVHELRRRCS